MVLVVVVLVVVAVVLVVVVVVLRVVIVEVVDVVLVEVLIVVRIVLVATKVSRRKGYGRRTCHRLNLDHDKMSHARESDTCGNDRCSHLDARGQLHEVESVARVAHHTKIGRTEIRPPSEHLTRHAAGSVGMAVEREDRGVASGVEHGAHAFTTGRSGQCSSGTGHG